MKKTEVVNLGIDEIKVPEEELRSFITQEKLIELAQSIKRLGILQPIIVAKEDNKYRIVAGVRRYEAAKYLEMGSIPAIVTELKEGSQAVAVLHENLIREDVNHLDIAKYIVRLKEKLKCTSADIAEMFNYSPAWVSRHLRLLDIPEELQFAVQAGQTDIDSALTLSRVPNPKKRNMLLKFAIEDGASQQAIRRWVADEMGRSTPAPAQSGAVDKVTPVPDPGVTTFKCFCCGETKDANDCITIRVDSECYRTLKKAIKIEKDQG